LESDISNLACTADGTGIYYTNNYDSDSKPVLTARFNDSGTFAFIPNPPKQLESIQGLQLPITSIACDAETVIMGDSSGNIWINSNGEWSLLKNLGTGRVMLAMTTNKIIACLYGGSSRSLQTCTNVAGVWTWQPQLNLEDNLWLSVAMSANGQRAMAMTSAGALFQGTWSSVGGGMWNNWIENQYFTLRFGPWDGLCMSASGDQIVVCGNPGGIYTAGGTPTDVGERSWSSIASSSDGQQLVACVYGENLWRSIDAGVSWTELSGLPSLHWMSVASDGTGQHLMAAAPNDDNYQMWYSSDGGGTWGRMTNDGDGATDGWTHVSISRNFQTTGPTAVAIGESLHVCFVVGEGTLSWSTMSSPSNLWRSTAINATGTVIAACTNETIWIYSSATTSIDNWRDASGAFGGYLNWTSIDMDDTGQHMVACVGNGDIYTSDDYGVTWIARNVGVGVHDWDTVASSADGSVIAAIEHPSGGTQGLIYISRDYGATWTSADYTTPPVAIPTLPPTQIAANIRGKDGAGSKLTDFNVGSTLVRNRPQRFTGFDDYGMFTQANAIANKGNWF